MWPEFVAPIEVKPKFKSQVGLPSWYQNSTCAFGFHRTDKTLHDDNGAILTDGAEARQDFPASAPAFEGFAQELTAFVRDDVFWGLAGGMDGAANEGPDLEGIGLVVENGKADNLS